ncbi:hypothetical protein [Pseudoalteromonas sp. R3]|uniref:hypothetical protein n=1 Tax=Pseudoalteromonas sp. R3 TaxID=1709477 RepID=UPI0006B61F1E|nr:hypothetical protein [Pseudoalteromonas sp. R3]AZZ99224.1 hypothetical protein ELR70_20340 [Pseudoalteromonas sp. R3]
MKLTLTKKNYKNLSLQSHAINNKMTPQVGGGNGACSGGAGCHMDQQPEPGTGGGSVCITW